jgi:hypothetical protein
MNVLLSLQPSAHAASGTANDQPRNALPIGTATEVVILAPQGAQLVAVGENFVNDHFPVIAWGAFAAREFGALPRSRPTDGIPVLRSIRGAHDNSE